MTPVLDKDFMSLQHMATFINRLQCTRDVYNNEGVALG